jgi:hypothetical protein
MAHLRAGAQLPEWNEQDAMGGQEEEAESSSSEEEDEGEIEGLKALYKAMVRGTNAVLFHPCFLRSFFRNERYR